MLRDRLNLITEIILYLMIVFSPWAFGTTQAWSIWTMNVGGYVLGGILLIKLIMESSLPSAARRAKGGKQPALRSSESVGGKADTENRCSERGRWIIWALAIVTSLILLYCWWRP